MRGGGDGYELFKTKAQNAYDFGPGLETVLADYLAGTPALQADRPMAASPKSLRDPETQPDAAPAPAERP